MSSRPRVCSSSDASISGWTWKMIDNWCARGMIGARLACRRRRSCRLGSIAQQLMLQYLAVAFLTGEAHPGRAQIFGGAVCFTPGATSKLFPLSAVASAETLSPDALLIIRVASCVSSFHRAYPHRRSDERISWGKGCVSHQAGAVAVNAR